ncbi:ribonuclease HII [Haloimpatiens sp. FM7315]|uniref:ribonuclease HII n=1 Tax=Haloimpatiens sp. FM7315 TaxID=3298609 RepID=UPI00370C79D9
MFKEINTYEMQNKNIGEIRESLRVVEKNIFNYSENDVLNYIELMLKDSRKTVQKLGVTLLKYKEKLENELNRVENMYKFDKYFVGNKGYLIGVDEVGRGPLAGPIVAAAVVLDLNFENRKDLILGIKDSKKLSAKKREELSHVIKSKAVAYSVCEVSNTEIDDKGIAWCNNKVFIDCINKIDLDPLIVLSDGYKVRGISIENQDVIKGDTKSASIACASILAKVYRDHLMVKNAEKYPGYGFENNVGYGTEEHIKAIHEKGITDIHRLSFLKNIL